MSRVKIMNRRMIGVLLATSCAVGAQAFTPPTVTITHPGENETFQSSQPVTIEWTAEDGDGEVTGIDVLVSFDDAATYDHLARQMSNDGALLWYVHNRPTAAGRIRIIATDDSGEVGEAVSAKFAIENSATGLVGTTLRDFDLPGTLPLQTNRLRTPQDCVNCHGGYDAAVEPYFLWKGSMMAYADRDPLFLAALEVTQREAPEVGNWCLRCHSPAGWMAGHATPSDGSQLQSGDLHGVSCDLCHRMVDPIYKEGTSPPEDLDILGGIRHIPDTYQNGMYVLDTEDDRKRGPFSDINTAGHTWLKSPLHLDSAMCGTCHNISNPVMQKQADGTFALNLTDAPPSENSAEALFPIDRTYSEWFYSAYNTPEGVYAPQFGGNREYVNNCQSCHMPAITGRGCTFGDAPVRDDLPAHHLSGSSVFMLSMMQYVYPDLDAEALAAGGVRASELLSKAAGLSVAQRAGVIAVTVTNNAGHKLPGGFAEGRRMWIGVTWFAGQMRLADESGRYEPETGELIQDAELKVYESVPVVSEKLAEQTGLTAGEHFHLVLSDTIEKDNRIPPYGWKKDEYERVHAGPVGAAYADGQYWDTSYYRVPAGATRAEVVLYFQSISREYAEFLRDRGAEGGPARAFYDAYEALGRSAPIAMTAATIAISPVVLGDMDCSGGVDFNDIDPFVLALIGIDEYETQFPDCEFDNADCNRDGSVDFDDIDAFIELLIGP